MVDSWGRGEAGFFFERGEALEQVGRLDEAMSEFKRAVRADPGLAEAHIALGYHYRRKNLLSKAAEEFRTAASLAPSYDSYFNLGHVLVDLGLHREAIAAFQQCLARSPGDSAVGYEIAYALYSAGDHAAALEQLQPLLSAHPDDWELHYLAGSCRLGLGQWPDAQACLEQAIAYLPADEDGQDLHEALRIALRYQEYASIGPNDLKARLYAEYGIACLGGLGDDGLAFTTQHRERISYQDIGRVLQRFHALRLGWGMQFDAVVSVDPGSTPLALALAHTLEIPLVEPQEAPEAGQTLLAWATVTVPELLEVVSERLRGPHLSLVTVIDEMSLERALPDVVGLVTTGRVSLPWESDNASGSASGAAREIVAAIRSLPPDDTLPAQVRYFSREHPRLRFLSESGDAGA